MTTEKTNFFAVNMNIDKLSVASNSANIINNYPSPPSQNSESEEHNKIIPDFPNQVKEALTTIKKFLSREKNPAEVKITKDQIEVDGKVIVLDYEACKLCQSQHANLACLQCERKVCSNCVAKKTGNCHRCKNAKKTQVKINSEYDKVIEEVFDLEKTDKIHEPVLVTVENLGEKDLEHLIELAKKLEKKSEKFDREISIAYFYVGKIFYERIEKFYGENSLTEEQKSRKILTSFRHAKDLDFGKTKMSVQEIKEKLGVNDTKLSRFFNLALKIYLIYKDFDGPENQIRKAKKVPTITWLRDLSQERFLDFCEKIRQKRDEVQEAKDI